MELQPYLTVGKDNHGNTCWIVVGVGCRVSCASGQRALEILEELTSVVSNGLRINQSTD